MYWTVSLLIALGVVVIFVIMHRYTQNKTLWITDMSANIWFSLPSEHFYRVKALVEEFNQTLPKSTGVVVVPVNFSSEDDLVERLEDSFYTFSTSQVPDMLFLSDSSMKRLYRKKFVYNADSNADDFRMFSVMSSIDLMYVNEKRLEAIKNLVAKNPEITDFDENMINDFDGLMKAADIYMRIQLDDSLSRSEDLHPFITVNSLNKLFVTGYMQLGGECKLNQYNYDAFYRVWHFIVKGLLLGYIVVIPEKKQYFNRMDTLKSPVALGYYYKNSYKTVKYPCYTDAVNNIAPVTKYGLSFVAKDMNSAKRSVLSNFIEWFMTNSKNIDLGISCGCLPLVDGKMVSDKNRLDDFINAVALDIDSELDHINVLHNRVDTLTSALSDSDIQVGDKLFTDDQVEKIVNKILDYVDACSSRLDTGIDYKDPDNDVVGTMYSRKAFDNWVNYFDL